MTDYIKKYGVVFTPPKVAAQLAAAIPRDKLIHGKIADSCCGEGALIIAVVNRMLRLGLYPHEIVHRIYGWDIMPHHVETTIDNLVKKLGRRHRKTLEKNFVVKDLMQDVLLRPPPSRKRTRKTRVDRRG
jgi:predicted RNA methylase